MSPIVTHQARPATAARYLLLLVVLAATFAVVAPSGAHAATTSYKTHYLYTLDGQNPVAVSDTASSRAATGGFNRVGVNYVRFASVRARVSGKYILIQRGSLKAATPRAYRAVANPQNVSFSGGTGGDGRSLASTTTGQYRFAGPDGSFQQIGLGSFLKGVAKKALGIGKTCVKGAVGANAPGFFKFVFTTSTEIPDGRAATAVGGCLTYTVLDLIP